MVTTAPFRPPPHYRRTLTGELLKRLIRLTTRRMACGEDLVRYAMYQQLRAFVTTHRLTGRLLSVSGSEGLAALFDPRETTVVTADYPRYDLLDLAFPEASFDLVVSDQVLEHVEGDPQRAVDESRRVLRPGGWAIHTTCVLQPLHFAPKDFWRFTPQGLAYLCRAFSHVAQASGWGTPWFPLLHQLDLRGIPVPHAPWHPLHRLATRNWTIWPVVTWVIAQK